jgi:dolichol-phosphate mannosyltransferase
LLKLLLPFGLFSIPATFLAAFLARAISSLVNFMINAKVVFGDQVSRRALFRYYFLVVVQISLSAAAVFLLEHLLVIRAAWLSTILKMIVDTILFFFSFRIQHKWVFNSEKDI